MYGSRSIYNKLLSLGVCSELTVKPGGDHGIYDETFASDIFRVNRACCFFKSLFCHNCSSTYLTDSIAPDCSLTGIPENENNAGISYYPNPCSGKFSIHSGRNENAIRSIFIYNVFGEKICSIVNLPVQKTNEIDISDFPKGMYFISINCTDGMYTGKILVQ